LQAEAGPMGCEPGGFGWSATVEVCSARVTRLVTAQEKSKKFSTRQLVPGTGRVDKICQHSDSGSQRCLAPGWGADLLSSVPGRNGAWHRVGGADLLASGPGRKGAWHRVGGLVC
jgi:hypothetical protein